MSKLNYRSYYIRLRDKKTSKTIKSQTKSLDEVKKIITRDIKLGSINDSLSDTSIDLYVRQMIKLYKAGVEQNQWDPKEFIDAIQSPTKYDDADFQKTFKVQNSDIVALLRSIYTSKETLIMTMNGIL